MVLASLTASSLQGPGHLWAGVGVGGDPCLLGGAGRRTDWSHIRGSPCFLRPSPFCCFAPVVGQVCLTPQVPAASRTGKSCRGQGPQEDAPLPLPSVAWAWGSDSWPPRGDPEEGGPLGRSLTGTFRCLGPRVRTPLKGLITAPAMETHAPVLPILSGRPLPGTLSRPQGPAHAPHLPVPSAPRSQPARGGPGPARGGGIRTFRLPSALRPARAP